MTSHPHHIGLWVCTLLPQRDSKRLVQSSPTLPYSLITSHLDLKPQELHDESPHVQLLPTSTISAPNNLRGQSHRRGRPAPSKIGQETFQSYGWQTPVPEGSVALDLSPSLYFCLLPLLDVTFPSGSLCLDHLCTQVH